MRFRSLRVDAFARFAEPFTLPLDTGTLTLVEGENRDQGGSNGSGKSSLIETLLWCLFGKMPRYGDRPVTTAACHPQAGARVAVTLELAGSTYRVTRSRTIKGSPEFSVEVIPPGSVEFVPYRLSRDPRRREEDVGALLGLDYGAMRAAVILQGVGTELAGAGFVRQMAVLETVLRLQELGAASDLARTRATAADREAAVVRAEVALLRQQVETAVEEVRAAQAALGRFDAAAERERLTGALRAAQEASAQAMDLETVVADARQVKERAQRAFLAAEATITPLVCRKQQMEADLGKAVCPTCGRPFEGRDLAAIRAQVAQVDQEIQAAYRAKGEADRQFQTAAMKLSGFEAQARAAHDAAAAAPRITEQLAQLERHVQEYERRLAEAAARQTAAADALAAREKAAGEAETRARRAEFWVGGFGRDGLQAEIFAAACPVLNQAAARYSRALTGGAITVEVSPLRDSRAQDLVRIGGANADTYEGLSSGEKQRVDLILALSLRDVARWRLPEPITLAVYDEVFSNMDALGMVAVSKLLQEEAARGTSVFVVTHSDAFRQLIPSARVIRVVRAGGFARVTE